MSGGFGMSLGNLGSSLQQIVADTAGQKGGGGQPAPQAFGQAGGGPKEAAPAAADQSDQSTDQPGEEDASPWDQYLAAGPNSDPTGKFREQQLNLATAGRFAGAGMGPNTSEALAIHGNKIRANAENWERYIQNIRLEAEMERLGISLDPNRPSGTEAFIKQHEAEKKKRESGVTPSGYDPAPTEPANQPSGQRSDTPAGYGMAKF
jgi:hypothetical protein